MVRSINPSSHLLFLFIRMNNSVLCEWACIWMAGNFSGFSSIIQRKREPIRCAMCIVQSSVCRTNNVVQNRILYSLPHCIGTSRLIYKKWSNEHATMWNFCRAAKEWKTFMAECTLPVNYCFAFAIRVSDCIVFGIFMHLPAAEQANQMHSVDNLLNTWLTWWWAQIML